MALQSHATQVPAGLELLDRLPAHWSVERVSNRALISIGWTPPTSDDSNFEGDNPWANISDLTERYVSETAKRVSDAAVHLARAKPSPAGSLLFSFKLSVGAVSFPTVPMYTNEAIAAFTPRRELEMRYAYYAFPIYILRNAGENIYGAPILNQTRLAQAKVAFPPFEEQRAIADYLDRETAQIDAFIAKNEELIALLSERRAAVVADLVTGEGAVGSAARIDSGVDWIGTIPSHWEVRPLRWSARIRTGTTPAGDSVFADEPGQPWIRPDDLDVSGGPSIASRWLTENGAAQGKPAAAGSTLLCTIGATLGKAGRVTRAAYFNQQITAVKWALNDEFLFWVFVVARAAVVRLSVGNTLPILNNEKLAGLRIPVPPLEEQSLIVREIKEQTARLDAAIDTARRGVVLGRERRAALIAAAVTGKIDMGVVV